MKAMLGGSLTLQNELYALISKLSNGEDNDECVAEGEGVDVVSEGGASESTNIDINVTNDGESENVKSLSGGSSKVTVISLDDVMRSATAASMSNVSSDMSGGVNISGLVENVLAGGDNMSNMVGNILTGGDANGSTNMSVEQVVDNIFAGGDANGSTNMSVEQVVDNIFAGGDASAVSTEYTGAEIISQILSDNDSDTSSESDDVHLPQSQSTAIATDTDTSYPRSSPSPSAVSANAAHIIMSTTSNDDYESDNDSEDLTSLAHDISLAIASEKNDEVLNDADINVASDDECSASEQSSDDDDDEDENKYVKILTEIESNEPVAALAGGGVTRSPQRVTVINMYPWIMRSFD